MARRPCLDCPNIAPEGQARCPNCTTRRTRARNRARGSATAQGYDAAWARHAKATIASYRAQHGDICPGYGHPPHPISPRDWCCDHDLGPMCRACNGRKAGSADRARAQARRGG